MGYLATVKFLKTCYNSSAPNLAKFRGIAEGQPRYEKGGLQ